MNQIDNSNIIHTIERFMAGETSIDEEKALYAFFARPDLPDGLEDYRPMFAWYASLGESEAVSHSVSPEVAAENHTTASESKVRLLPFRPWQWLSIAAMLVLLFSVGFFLRDTGSKIPEEYLSYEGSYIIRDGKKITDLRVVVPEILRTEAIVNDRLDAIDMSLEEGEDMFDRSVLDSYDTSDPEVRDLIYATLDY